MIVRLLVEGPPLDPTAERARELLGRELAKPIYDSTSLLQRVLDWLGSWFHGGGSGSGPPPGLVAGVVLLVLAIAVVVLLRRVRPESAHRNRAPEGVFDSPPLSARGYRRRALSAVERGAWDDAVLDGYRALAADAAERGVLVLTPGLTTMELELAIASAHPQEHAAVEAAAHVFDRVRYGGQHADREAATALLALGERLGNARSSRFTAPVGGGGS